MFYRGGRDHSYKECASPYVAGKGRGGGGGGRGRGGRGRGGSGQGHHITLNFY